MPERGFIPPSELGLEKPDQTRGTSPTFKKRAKLWLEQFCTKLDVVGQENLSAVEKIKAEDHEAKFIVAGSHFSHLDVPATIVALGDEFDFQVTGESVLFQRGRPEREVMMRLGGVKNFSPISYKETKTNKRGIFNPDDFTEIEGKMAEGKTPWMATHEFNFEKNELGAQRVGAVYLAQESGAYIIPTAVETQGSNPDLATLGGMVKGRLNRKKTEITYHVGEPIKLEPIDVSPIKTAIEKRKAKIRLTAEEIQAFRDTHQELKAQAQEVAEAIAAMLPKEQRGEYKD